MNTSIEIAIIKRNKKYIIMAGLLLFVGAIIGGIFAGQIGTYIEDELSKLKELVEKINDNGSPFYASWVIFWNNLRAAIVFILLGSFFAIVPIMGLGINGILIGVVLSLANEAGVSPLMLIIFGVMPHGIFEIPAIIIAGAMGIKLGTVWIKPLPGLTRWESYKSVWIEIRKIMILLLGLLLVAALVEGLITPLIILLGFHWTT